MSPGHAMYLVDASQECLDMVLRQIATSSLFFAQVRWLTSPYCTIIFLMASSSVRQAVILLCSVAGILLATGRPSFSSNYKSSAIYHITCFISCNLAVYLFLQALRTFTNCHLSVCEESHLSKYALLKTQELICLRLDIGIFTHIYVYIVYIADHYRRIG